VNVEPVIKILPESACFDFLLEVAVLSRQRHELEVSTARLPPRRVT
jgi:hypothetical protein